MPAPLRLSVVLAILGTIAIFPFLALRARAERAPLVHNAAPVAAAPAPPAAAPARAPTPLLARVRAGRAVRVHRRPGRGRGRRLGARTEFGSRQVLGVMAVRDGWLGVASMARTDGRLAWVKGSNRALAIAPAPVTIEIDLSARRLRLLRGGRVLRRMRVAVGRPGSPTPAGRFAVTDKLSGGRFGAYYGCCILALSGTQPKLPPGWRGGNRLAIHGTNTPGSIGRASSAGCLRGSDRDLRGLMGRVPLGTPVTVRR